MYDKINKKGALAQLGAHNTGSVGVTSSSLVRSTSKRTCRSKPFCNDMRSYHLDGLEGTFMFLSKKIRIRNYLDSIEKNQWYPFEFLLDDYLSGKLIDYLAEYGISKLSFSVDFHDDYKCINVDGKYKSYYIDLQIENNEFSIGCDPAEPDDHKYFKLESPEYLYSVVNAEIRSLK